MSDIGYCIEGLVEEFPKCDEHGRKDPDDVVDPPDLVVPADIGHVDYLS